MATLKITLTFLLLFLFIFQLSAQEASFNREREKLFYSIDRSTCRNNKEENQFHEELINAINRGLKDRFTIVKTEYEANKIVKIKHQYNDNFDNTISVLIYDSEPIKKLISSKTFYAWEINDMLEFILEKIPIGIRIMSLNSNDVTIDAGAKDGIKVGQRFEFYSNADIAGLLEVISIGNQSAEARIISGIPKVGFLIKKRNYRLTNGLQVSYHFLRASVKTNKNYKSKRPDDITTAHKIDFDWLWNRSNGLFFSIGIEYLFIGSLNDAFFTVELGKNIEFSERTEIYFGTRVGSGGKFTQTFIDPETDESGNAIHGSSTTYTFYTGIKYSMSQKIFVSIDIGYHIYDIKNDAKGKDSDGKNRKIPVEWLEYTDIKISGLAPRIGFYYTF